MSKQISVPGEKHYTSTVFLITEEKPRQVLLMHHKKLDCWMPPGGHQENMENPYETAIREVKEETGIDIAKHLPQPEVLDDRAISLPLPEFLLEEQIDARGDQPDHFHLDMTYVVAIPHQESKNAEAESNDLQWFGFDQLDSIKMFKNVEIVVRKLLSN